MPVETPTVPGEPNTAPVANTATPAVGGVEHKSTPAQTPVDAEAIKKDFDAKAANLQKDLNKLKSTFQQREAQLVREAQEREKALKDELDKTRISTMDEETRRAYEYEMSRGRISELEQSLADAQRQLENYQVTQNAIAHFRRLGVPEDVLVQDADLDTLLASGWEWVSNRLVELNQPNQTPTPTPPASPPTLPTPPAVDMGSGTPASARPRWEDIVGPGKKYESREQVYELFEQRRIPPEAIPLD